MNILIALAALAGMFSNSGCRSARDNQIDILERELRSQEDYIYELEDYIVEYSEKLRQYRCVEMTSVVVSKEPGVPDLAIPPRNKSSVSPPSSQELLRSLEKPTDNEVPGITEPEIVTPKTVDPEIIEESPENLEAPELELEIGEPIGADFYENATPLAEADIEGALLADGSFIPDPSAYLTSVVEDAGDEEAVEEMVGDDVEIVERVEPFEEDITPTKRHEPETLVISHVFRNSAEAESLLSIIEARDASNEPADFNGKVSLMVMTALDGKPKRVKRWDFTTDETSAAWQSSTLGDGLHLELPLEETDLPGGPLELWVRLETNDGRKLLSQLSFEQATLASIDEADEHVAQADDEVDGATHLAEANPLRVERSSIPGSKIPRPKVPTNPVVTAENESKTEPQWRAATHYSAGTNSGFATTATAKQWTSRPIGSKAATETAVQPKANGSQQQWRARK
jgi:hypothetical protein